MRRPRRGASSEVRARSFSAASCLETRFRSSIPFLRILQLTHKRIATQFKLPACRKWVLAHAALSTNIGSYSRPKDGLGEAKRSFNGELAGSHSLSSAEKAYRQATAHSQRIDRLWPEMDGFFNWRSDRKDTRILGEQMDAIDRHSAFHTMESQSTIVYCPSRSHSLRTKAKEPRIREAKRWTEWQTTTLQGALAGRSQPRLIRSSHLSRSAGRRTRTDVLLFE